MRKFTPGVPTMVAAVLLSACTKLDLSGPGSDETLAENHPAALDSISHFIMGPGFWSHNGAEFAYVRPGAKVAVARSAASGTTRTLYTAAASEHIYMVELGPDGSEWITVSRRLDLPGLRVQLHKSGGVQLLTDNGGTRLAPYGNALVVRHASNGDIAYIVNPDSLFIRRHSSGAVEFIGAGCDVIAAVAPTGEGVLCYRPLAFNSIWRYAGAGTAPVSVTVPEPWAVVIQMQWTAQGIDVVTRPQFDRFAIEKLSDPSTRYTTPSYKYPESTGISVSLATTGRSFAFANSHCAQSSSFLSCGKNQNIYYIADDVTRTTKRLAVQTSPAYPYVALSPDGGTLAYTDAQQLYMVSAK